MTAVSETTNSERVQTLLHAFGRGDDETVLGLVDPAIELLPLVVRAGHVPAPYRGVDGVRAYLGDPQAAGVERSFEVTKLRSIGETVVVFGNLLQDGTRTPALWVWRLRAGLATHGAVVSDESVVGARPGAARTALWLELPATPESVGEARHAVRVWADNLTPTVVERDAIMLAVSEAATNVVRHAYRGGEEDASFRIRADVQHGRLHLTLEDDGVGLSAVSSDPGLGIGIPLLGHLAAEVTLCSAPERQAGCEVRMAFPLAALEPRGSP